MLPAVSPLNEDDAIDEVEPLKAGARVLERYVVVERIEVGGSSVVYLGEDERLARPVCIKVFNTLRDKEWLYRTSYQHFVQEAFALSRLGHPNTLRIYDFGHLPDPTDETDGLPVQISEYLNGGTLSSLVRSEGAIGGPEASRIVEAIGGALDEAHQAGIVHRDIKPRNILFAGMGPRRQPKLADFGIAKSFSLDEDALRNQAGDTHIVAGRRLLMYSGPWASPEQLQGQVVSPASDIYSWALVTLYMLSGQSVFAANEAAEALVQRQEADALIGEAVVRAKLPDEMIALFRRACALEPSERMASAGQFATMVIAALERRPTRRLPLPSPDLEPVGTRPEDDVPTTDLPRLRERAGEADDAGPTPSIHRLAPTTGPQMLGERTGRFAKLVAGAADVTTADDRVRVRAALIPLTDGRVSIHLRGLNCFVRKAGGRASGACQLDESGAVEFVTAGQTSLGSARVLFGSWGDGQQVFDLGDQRVAIGLNDSSYAVALDFGREECVFVVQPRA
jgi:serine/threonine-protein kinase